MISGIAHGVIRPFHQCSIFQIIDILNDNNRRILIYNARHIYIRRLWERISIEYETKRILVNAGIVVGVLVVGILAFYGVLKLFSVLANIPFP
jgi:hypothetical protein